MRFHHPIDMAQEMLHLAVILQEPDYRGIRSGKAAVLFIASGIMDIAAIEHISPAIAGIVLGQPFLVSEAAYFDFKASVRLCLLAETFN